MGDALSKEPVSQELFISLEFLKKPDFFKCIFFFWLYWVFDAVRAAL